MKRQVHVGVASLNQTPMGWRRNATNIKSAIEAARAQGVKLLLLPELSITGYGCEDQFHSQDVSRRAWKTLQEILPLTKGMVVVVGLPVWHRRAIYNCAAVIADGELRGLVAKQNLAGDGVHYEQRWFKPWPATKVAKVKNPITNKLVQIGDLIFEIDGIRIGLEVCEDAWVPDRPGRALARRAVDFILNPSASHFAFGKRHTRRGFVLEASRAFGAAYLYCNLGGNESGRTIYDFHRMIAAGGSMLAESELFSFRMCELTTAIIDVNKLRMSAARTASFAASVDDDPNTIVIEEFSFGEATGTPILSQPAAWQSGGNVLFEEAARAVALGGLDYLEKSGMQGFTVSLSGGADSSITVALVADAVGFGVHQLGVEGFKARFRKIHFPEGCDSVPALVHHLLFTAYQTSANSTAKTFQSAQELAKAVGARFAHWNIDHLVNENETIAAEVLGRPLTWETDDIARQNIQARVRATPIWTMANVFHHLLLTTSNRSEADVGYATMDGDTAGSFNLVGGLAKVDICEWLVWREKIGPAELGPLAALSYCNALQPSAELRPKENTQTDEKDLMPYSILRRIEAYGIRDKQAPEEVFQSLLEAGTGYSKQDLGKWVKKFFTMWCRNQWKRERYAPCLHLDDLNTDPRSWCRFPIISSGFEEELEELDAMLASLAA